LLILVDAMGGDHAPYEIVKGCMDAITEKEGYEVLLIGDKEKIQTVLTEHKFSSNRLKIHNTTEIITNEDLPTKAIKNKKDSSMVVGFNLLKEKKGDIFISAGNTGALMAGGLFIIGRIEGVDRPALAPLIPTQKGFTLLIDAGANTVCKPINYLQFAIMGTIYMKERFKMESPKVGLINVGSEDKKGTEQIRQAHGTLSGSNINFIGNVEANQIPMGKVDIAVCDGFIGNVVLKLYEGLGLFFFGGLKEVFYKNIVSKMAALTLKRGLKAFQKRVDPNEYGGTLLLGVDGLVMKSHGSSNAKAIKNSVLKASDLAQNTIIENIREEFKNVEVDDIE
jgi:phosphate acyltransferase